MKERLLVSACLVGGNCKYSGGNNVLPAEKLAALRERYALVPVCPELMGGLSVPRSPCERRGGRVVNREGKDVTEAFGQGAALFEEAFYSDHPLGGDARDQALALLEETERLLTARANWRRRLPGRATPSCAQWSSTRFPGSGRMRWWS